MWFKKKDTPSTYTMDNLECINCYGWFSIKVPIGTRWAGYEFNCPKCKVRMAGTAERRY